MMKPAIAFIAASALTLPAAALAANVEIATGGPVVELRRRRWRGVVSVTTRTEPPQVVGREPGTDDERPRVAQRRELAAQLEQLDGVERRHRLLQDGHVGVGEHLDEGVVRAVVETA